MMKRIFTSRTGCMAKFSLLLVAAITGACQVMAQPTVSSISPSAGYPGSTVQITGTGFNSTPGNDIVYFGATRAVVNSASTTSLSVTVPVGATYMPVTVNNAANGLMAYSVQSFLPDYDNSAYIPGTVSFDPKVDFIDPLYSSQPSGVCLSDIDGDGKADMVVTGYNSI